MHYAGAAFLLFGSVALCFMDNFSSISVSLFIVESLLAAAYFVASELVPKRSEDIKVVTRSSRICIIIELSTFVFTGIILGLTMNGSGRNGGNVWSSPSSYTISGEPTCASV